jgi:putative FmdB family regulatory protein
MPIYEYKCKSCSFRTEEYRKVQERTPPGICIKCGGLKSLEISLTANAYISKYPYFDPILDREITDPGHRRKVMKQCGLEEKG